MQIEQEKEKEKVQFENKDEKKKKYKKKKKKKKDKDIENIDMNKVAQDAKHAKVHNYQITKQMKQRYSLIQAHPLKMVIYNLPLHIDLEQLNIYFQTTLKQMAPEIPNPIKSITLDKTKQFAILQLNNFKAKQFFKLHSQYSYLDSKTILKVKKPKYYFAQRFKKNGKEQEEDFKVFMGGIPITLKQMEVRAICQKFGQLKFFNLVKDGDVSKGYCFFQYQDIKNTEKAINALNNLPIADRRLKVQRASIGDKQKNTGVVLKPTHYTGQFLNNYENFKDLYVQLTLQIPSSAQIPSRVVQLLNMFAPQDLFQSQFYSQLERDLSEESSKYGSVQKIVIPRPDPISGYCVPSVGKVFIKFNYVIPAKRARHHIAGKIYNRRTVIASYYPQEKFDQKQYLIGY